MFCSSCGVKNEGGAKFCSGCGKPMGGASPQAGGTSSQPAPSSQSSGPAVQVNKCPACRAPIESFQTRCSSCGTELNTAQAGESVQSFFKKLEEITEREYAADKQREKDSKIKKKKNQPKALVICEAVAIVSIILIILNVTNISEIIIAVILAFFANG